MVTILKADFVHEVREGNQAYGLGSFLPPPAPFVNGFGHFLHCLTPVARALLAAHSQYYILNDERLVVL
jgi:hypothetical protein